VFTLEQVKVLRRYLDRAIVIAIVAGVFLLAAGMYFHFLILRTAAETRQTVIEQWRIVQEGKETAEAAKVTAEAAQTKVEKVETTVDKTAAVAASIAKKVQAASPKKVVK
jgi:hypothetical protein